MQVQLRHLHSTEESKAAAVLARAFVKDPIGLEYVPSTRPDRLAELEEVFRIFIGVRFATGIPNLCAVVDGEIVGVALVTHSDAPEWPKEFEEAWAAVEAGLEEASLRAVVLHEELKHKHASPGPHAFLSLIGVEPNLQGRGIGRKLLAYADQTVMGFGCTRIDLDTATPKNVGLYESFGYVITGRDDFCGKPWWYMEKPLTAMQTAAAS